MGKPRRQSWKSLDPALRADLTELLAAHRARQSPLASRFYNDSDGFHAFMLLAFLAAVGGAAAGTYEWTTEYDPPSLRQAANWLFSSPISFVRFAPHVAGVLLLTPVAVLIAVVWLANYRRRGLALTPQAVVIVRGPRLRVIRLADIATTSQKNIGYGSRSFAELRLTLESGGDVVLWTRDRHWASLVQQAVPTGRPLGVAG